MSTTEDSPSTSVSFAVEEATPAVISRKTSTELRAAKDRASLSQSAKAWDLDGDGELDDAELALRNLDKSHKGTLSKEQMYKLMSDNLQTQRELFKVKKVVIGLVVFTCILAISNLGTSLAAAFLAKDTKSEDDALVDSKTARTLATDTMSEEFVIDLEFDQQFSRRNRKLCDSAAGGGVHCTVSTWSAIDFNIGATIADKCSKNKSVTITKTFGNKSVQHPICPVTSPHTKETSGGGNGPTATPIGVKIFRGSDGDDIDIQPTEDETAYTITGITSAIGQGCSADTDCTGGAVCEVGQDILAGGTCMCNNSGGATGCASGEICSENCVDSSPRKCTTKADIDAECESIFGTGYECSSVATKSCALPVDGEVLGEAPVGR